MRIVVLLDQKIDKDEALAMLASYADWVKETANIDVTYWVERRDFTFVPTEPDEDGDLKPTYKYRQNLCKEIHSRYNDYGTDYILMWVHEDNFLFKGVWGTAWSYTHFKYNFLLARWDKKNKVNTFNTLLHEGEHPHDTTLLKEIGIDIEPLIAKEFDMGGFDYDAGYVHGKSPDFKYIGKTGYKRDGRMLKFLSPYLKTAFAKRRKKHEDYINQQGTIIGLLKTMVELWEKIIKT